MNSSNKKALCTLAIGGKYEEMFNKYCRKNFEMYCNNYLYDLIVITQSLDNSNRSNERSPAWQKLLILSQEWSSKYEQIVWVDADIIINNSIAPDITCMVPLHKIGAVEAYSIPSNGIYKISLQRNYDKWRSEGISFVDNKTQDLYYKNRGISCGSIDKVVQTGVFVCSPKHHKEIFEYIYYSYEDEFKSAEWNYEMPAMSYELVNNGVVEWLPEQYNFCVSDITSAFYPFILDSSSNKSFMGKALAKLSRKLKIRICGPKTKLRRQCLKNIHDLGYFIHFAGCSHMMEELCQSFKDNA